MKAPTKAERVTATQQQRTERLKI